MDEVVERSAFGVLEAGDRVLERSGDVGARGCLGGDRYCARKQRREIVRDGVEVDEDAAAGARNGHIIGIDAGAAIDGVGAVGRRPGRAVHIVAATELDCVGPVAVTHKFRELAALERVVAPAKKDAAAGDGAALDDGSDLYEIDDDVGVIATNNAAPD